MTGCMVVYSPAPMGFLGLTRNRYQLPFFNPMPTTSFFVQLPATMTGCMVVYSPAPMGFLGLTRNRNQLPYFIPFPLQHSLSYLPATMTGCMVVYSPAPMGFLGLTRNRYQLPFFNPVTTASRFFVRATLRHRGGGFRLANPEKGLKFEEEEEEEGEGVEEEEKGLCSSMESILTSLTSTS